MGCPIYAALPWSPAAAALALAHPLPRYCDGPMCFSLISWRRGAAAPHCPHLRTQRGLLGTTTTCLDVCFWWGGKTVAWV